MSDRHRFFLVVDDGQLIVNVQCPYPRDSQARPCWPREENGELMPAPQGECVYDSWVDNLSADEILHGGMTVEVACEVDWDDGMSLTLLGPVTAHYVPDVGEVAVAETRSV